MNESESLGLHSYNQPRDPLSAREAENEERREQFSLAERLKMTAAEKREKLSTDLFSTQSTDRQSSQNEPSRKSGLI